MINLKLKIRIIEVFGSQTKFANAVGMTEQKVSRIITGRTPINEEEKIEFALTLNSKVEDIF